MKNNYLDSLFIKYGTDKSSLHHNYSPNYEAHFGPIKDKALNVLILGIGGYEFIDRGGGDIFAFEKYFTNPRTKIFAVDIHEKQLNFPERVTVFKGSQDDGDFLMPVMQKLGTPDIIIDDASHLNKLTIESFKHLFPWLKSEGMYVIEDIESSWWNTHGFDGQPNPNDLNKKTTINFCRALLNSVNEMNIDRSFDEFDDFIPDWIKGIKYEIKSMHFYNNMVVIIKK